MSPAALLLALFLLFCQVVMVAPSALDFGEVSIGSSSSLPVTASFPVVPHLAFGVDFQIETGNCSQTSCKVDFNPKYPGLREDALVAKDSAGNVVAVLLYGIGLGPQVSVQPGMITTVAGTGSFGYWGDGGVATQAAMENPQSVAVDPLGNLFIMDSINEAVREVNAAGIISTIPNTGGWFSSPVGLALDAARNIYVADSDNNKVFEINGLTGNVAVLAGGGNPAGGLGDGGPATSANLSGPSDVAVDAAGNVFIADTYHGLIRKVDVSGVIWTVAGGGTSNVFPWGDGGAGSALTAALSAPRGVALNANGSLLYISDTGHQAIRQVTLSTGAILTFAGNGSAAYGGDQRPAVQAALCNPLGISVDPAGDVFIADSCNNVVREVLAGSGVITTVAGRYVPGLAGDGGSPLVAELNSPFGVALDSTGNLFIADSVNNVIREVTFSPQGVNFGVVNVPPANASQAETVFNIGNRSLDFSSLVVSGAFQLETANAWDCSSSSVVMPGTWCLLSIQPTLATGSSTGSISFTTNSLNSVGSTESIGLTSGPRPQLQVTPASLNFSTQNVGTASVPQAIVLKNVGTAALSTPGIVPALIGSNAGSFKIAGSNCSTLPVGATCTVSVVFAPQTTGAQSAEMASTSALINSSLMIPLVGAGAASGAVKLSSNELLFPVQIPGGTSAAEVVTLTNTGGSTLFGLSAALTGLASLEFKITSDTCTNTSVPAGQTCSVSIAFAPNAEGLQAASLTFADSAADSPQSVLLGGSCEMVGAGIYDDTGDPWIQYSGAWQSNTDTGRYDGTQTFTKTAGDTASFTFTGTQVTYVYEAQANMGHAQVLIDGNAQTDLDEYSPVSLVQQKVSYTGLTYGTHTITIKALGTKDPAATGSYVIVDAFLVDAAPAGIYDDTGDPWIQYSGAWQSNTDTGRYDGTQTFTKTAGDTASFTFTGTQVTYVYEAQANMGHAQVLIDGNAQTDLDEYSPVSLVQQKVSYTGLTYGTHTITIKALGTKDPAATGSYVIVDAFLVDAAPAGIYDDTGDPWIQYSGAWQSNTDTGRYDGTQTFTQTVGDTASFTFTGTQVTYVYEAQANMGHAQVLIDGNAQTDLDEYSPVSLVQQKVSYTGLTYGTHTITIKALGTKDPAATGSYVIVDAFLVDAAPAGIYDDTGDPWIQYSGAWQSNTDTGRYDGTQTFTQTVGDTASFTFTGTQVTYVYEAQPNMGHAQVLIDGNVQTPDLDEYSPVSLVQQKVSYTGLTYGTHTITIKALGTKDAAATGSYVIVDAFLVGP